MKNLNRVVWSKGMFLTPQHFQLQDRFLQDLLQFRFSASSFANWGVTELRIDAEGLANGTFRLDRCRGILPDGMAFEIPDTDEPPPSRPILDDHFPPTTQSLDVYLAIPELRDHSDTVTIPPSNHDDTPAPPVATRYLAETRQIADEIGGVEEKAVQIARPRFRLLFESEALEGYTSLRIAQVQRDRAGAYALNPRYVAPCLDIASSDYLMTLLRRQVELLSTRVKELGKTRRQAEKGKAEFSATEITNYSLLHTVSTYLPVLNHLWKVRRGHPETAYVTLLQLAGALSTLVLNVDPGSFPEYDHKNLGPRFTELEAILRDLAQTPVPENCVEVPLTRSDRYLWTGEISDSDHLKNSQFFLAISANMTVEELIREVPRRVRIASTVDMDRLIRNALPGLSLRHAAKPPAGIPQKFGNEYFGISLTGALWDGVQKSRNVSVYVPSEIGDPKMEVLILLEDKS